MQITDFEQRATVYYTFDGIIYKRFTGWVMNGLTPGTVTARKIGGRNRYLLCHINDIYNIEPATQGSNR